MLFKVGGMKKSLKKGGLLTLLLTISVLTTAQLVYMNRSVDTALIDTEVCSHCSVCWVNYSDIFEQSAQGYAKWVYSDGVAFGVDYYNYPTSAHKEWIQEAEVLCPSAAIIYNWSVQ